MKTTILPNPKTNTKILNTAVIVAALGYFVDVYDLLLFGIVRVDSLKDIGVTGDAIRTEGEFLISMQMYGMLLGGILWGVLGDKKGRISVLFGSILMYSVANIANGMVHTVDAYAFWRLIAGIGLAGELGAGITLVTESLPTSKRGYGTMIVASIGVIGAVVAYLVYQLFQDWRLCYYAGGVLGMLLLFMRISIHESGMFKKVNESFEKKGDFLSLFATKKQFFKYAQCILTGVPIWFLIGILITFSPEFAKVLGVQNFETIQAGKAIAFYYTGLVFGDIVTGLLSQWLQSRKKVMYLFLVFNLIMVLVFLNAFGISTAIFYALCLLMGFSSGYWVLFVTIAAEQFGTNIRATVTTTVPNFVRGSLPLIILIYGFFRDKIFDGNILYASTILGVILFAIALWALKNLKETFHTNLDYLEPAGEV
jgi:MFS transporter, putative metabolite:H+ symporter